MLILYLYVLPLVLYWCLAIFFPNEETFKERLKNTTKGEFIGHLLCSLIPMLNIAACILRAEYVIKDNVDWDKVCDWLNSPVIDSDDDDTHHA